MINKPGRELVCVFGREIYNDEMFLYICDECGHGVCSDHSEWVIVGGPGLITEERWQNRYTRPIVLDDENLHVRVCVGCINPGLTIEEWKKMPEGFEAKRHEPANMIFVEGSVTYVRQGTFDEMEESNG